MAQKKANKQRNNDYSGNAVDFPRITLDTAIKLCQRINEEYANVVSYEDLSKIIGAGGRTKGGKFAIYLKGLKLYGLIERSGKSEAKLSEDAKRIIKAPLEEKKNLMYAKFLSIPSFKKILDKYPEGIPQKRKPLTSFIAKEENMDVREAGRLVGTFWREYSVFSKLPSLKIPEQIGDNQKPKDYEEEQKDDTVSRENYKLSLLVGTIFPSENKQEINKTLEEIYTLSNDLGLKEFSGLITGIKLMIKGKDDNEINEQLKSLSKEVRKVFEKSIGIEEQEENEKKSIGLSKYK